MSWPKGAATPGLPCGTPGSRAGKGGMGKDGSGAPKVTQQGHASMEGLFVLPPMAPYTIAYTPPISQESAHRSTIPSPLTTEGKTLLPVLGDRGKGLLGKSCTHWFRKLAHTELHLFWLILLCSLRLTW